MTPEQKYEFDTQGLCFKNVFNKSFIKNLIK